MATKYIITTTGLTLYGKAAKDSTPWAADVAAITEDAAADGLYPAQESHPFIYVQAGASPADSDEFLLDCRESYYGSVPAGDAFASTRVHSWDWSNNSVVDRVKALYTATDIIDKFSFVGHKTVSTQGLEFPRTRTLPDETVALIGGVSTVPKEIERAAYLIADALLGGRDPQADFESQNVKVETFGPIRTEFATDKGPMQHIANLVPSPAAWALIFPFLGISTSFRVGKS